jgi:acetyl-CoA acyltransferase
MTKAVIVDTVRTASERCRKGGALSTVHPAELLATVLRALVERTGIDPGLIDDVVAGCLGQAVEQSMNTGRTAALAAGVPIEVPGTTVDRQCGSSQQALHFAAGAFASVPFAWATEDGADLGRLNPRGGAIALGHPLGASGIRIRATLLNHLEATSGQYGLQTVCEADGLANATVIERL